MTAIFETAKFTSKEVTPDMICDEVEMIGFDCELSGITEISAEDLLPNRRLSVKRRDSTDRSIDSAKVRGEDDDESFDEIRSTQGTP